MGPPPPWPQLLCLMHRLCSVDVPLLLYTSMLQTQNSEADARCYDATKLTFSLRKISLLLPPFIKLRGP